MVDCDRLLQVNHVSALMQVLIINGRCIAFQTEPISITFVQFRGSLVDMNVRSES